MAATGRVRTRRRILHVIPVLWSGAGEALTRLCELQASRYEITVATSGLEGSLRDWPAYRRRLRAAGVRHIGVNTFARTPEAFWPAVEELRTTLRRWAPDIVHTHAGVPATAVALARDGSSPRHVAHMYSWGQGRPGWMNDMDLAGFRHADRVVCSARSYQDLLLKGGVSPARLAYIPWGVTCERIDAALARRRHAAAGRPEPEGIHLGFVGRVEPRKGQLDLIAAFDLIRRRVPRAHLHLVGPDADPVYAERCRAEIARRTLRAHVTWHGHVPDVARLLVEWTLFVSLSSDEGQGLAVQEAMAAQVPVVALAAPGIEDFVTDGRTGRLVHDRRARGVAAAAVDALGDRAQAARLARAGARLIRSRYSWARCDTAIDRQYRQRPRRRVRTGEGD